MTETTWEDLKKACKVEKDPHVMAKIPATNMLSEPPTMHH